MSDQEIDSLYQSPSRADKRSKREHMELIEAMRAALDHGPSRQVIWWFLNDITKLFKGSMTGNSYTFFNEGKRQCGILLLDVLDQADPDALFRLRNEFLKKELIETKRRSRGDSKENNEEGAS
jgi:hypothetical protein